ncbi:glycosyl hydrolase [Paenibacillus lycopersici]|uniref:Glycosyl hydrolase n=1 Tax=Paenibacillus lycopersici TaxID=2704462 RepID=A0A6C0FPE7_9BACL|nr:glycosyl hydrolase family 18 protein [Paenibacillus lycopersici]QHT58996.1 glycosyl hydrolase [Paenibacillus lycopersici]
MRRRSRSRRKSAAGLAIVAAAIAVFLLYTTIKDRSSDNPALGAPPVQSGSELPFTLSAWIVDWQWEAGIGDFDAIASGLDHVQAFAAYFGSKDELYFTETDGRLLPETLAAARRGGVTGTQLTVVNDRYTEDGSSSEEKDPALVRRLMLTGASRGKHMDNLLAAMDNYGFEGLELDYEKVPDGTWNNYALFIRELYARLHEQGKSLRVVLESRAPIEKLRLPEGPEYVMMAYNLYGGFSGPGPKADDKFIARLANRMKALPGDNAVALSLGGFDWSANGQVTALTEEKAAELSSGARQLTRDGASGSLYFDYKDEAGAAHTVWYADSTTLKRWIGVVRKSGLHKVALWRLGGLSDEMRTAIQEGF